MIPTVSILEIAEFQRLLKGVHRMKTCTNLILTSAELVDKVEVIH